jgi:hypothetical protein
MDNLVNTLQCVVSSPFLFIPIMFSIILAIIPVEYIYKPLPWAPEIIARLVSNSTFHICLMIILIILTCGNNPKAAIGLYIIHIALLNKFKTVYNDNE